MNPAQSKKILSAAGLVVGLFIIAAIVYQGDFSSLLGASVTVSEVDMCPDLSLTFPIPFNGTVRGYGSHPDNSVLARGYALSAAKEEAKSVCETGANVPGVLDCPQKVNGLTCGNGQITCEKKLELETCKYSVDQDDQTEEWTVSVICEGSCSPCTRVCEEIGIIGPDSGELPSDFETFESTIDFSIDSAF